LRALSKVFAPKESSHRKALKYDGSDNEHPDALDPNSIRVWHVDMIQQRNGYGYAFRVPPGINPSMYELWENQKKLGPADSLLTDISNVGEGRYAIVDRELFFSSSDNSDARKNDQSYSLRRR
jgi:hypothetical protein